MTAPIEVGDEVEGVGIHSGSTRRGRLLDRAHKYGPLVLERNGNTGGVHVKPDTLRLIRKRAESSAPSEGEFYGTMPAELPKTLPAGTKSEAGRVALETVTLGGGTSEYRGRWSNLDGGEQAAVLAGFIDWTTVRRSPAPSDETKAAEPGDYCEAITTASDKGGAGLSVRGWYDGECDGHELLKLNQDRYGNAFFVDPSSIRVIARRKSLRSPATSLEKPPDPYSTTATETTSYALWAAEEDGRHAAMVAKHAADLDRSTESRLVALGGRYGKRVGLVNRNWPSQDGSDEP